MNVIYWPGNIYDEKALLTSTLMAQRPMARTALRTKSTSTSVAYSFSSASTWKWPKTAVTFIASKHNTTPHAYITVWSCDSLLLILFQFDAFFEAWPSTDDKLHYLNNTKCKYSLHIVVHIQKTSCINHVFVLLSTDRPNTVLKFNIFHFLLHYV